MGTRIDKESNRSERMLKLLSIVSASARGVPMADLHRDDWGDPATIRRLILFINQCWERFTQKPLLEVVDESGRIARRGERFLRFAASIKERERFRGRSSTGLVAFHAMFEFLRALERTVITDAVLPIYEYMKRELSPSEAKKIARLEEKFAFVARGAKSYAAADDVLDVVYEATLSERKLEIEFVCKGEAKTDDFRPLGLVSYSNGLYLVGHFDKQADAEEPYMFKIETLLSARMLSASFAYPAGFRLKERYCGRFGLMRERGAPVDQVELEFPADEAIKRAIRERIYTAADRYEELADGRMILRFPAQGLKEVKSWVLSWGSNVKVIGPAPLRDLVRDEAKKVAAQC